MTTPVQPPSAKRGVVACVTRDRLADAAVLCDSIRRHDNVPVTLVVLGDEGDASRLLPSDIIVLNEHDLALPDLRRFLFQYTGFELCCAVKPWLVERAMAHGCGRTLYLDSDFQVYGPLTPIFDRLAEAGIVLTPHLAQQGPVSRQLFAAHAPDLRSAGLFNAGFIGVANTNTGREFLGWWTQRCRFDSIVDMSGGVFVDQGWLDFAPLVLDGIETRNPLGWNVGHWNVLHYGIAETSTGQVTVGGDPLVCFHFSGFDPTRPERLSKWDKRNPVIRDQTLLRLAREYAAALQAARSRIPVVRPPPFSRLSDGTEISPLWREAIRTGHHLLADVENPFDVTRNPRLKARFRTAALDVLDSRKDWQHEGVKELGKRVQKLPILGYWYRLARAAIEQYR